MFHEILLRHEENVGGRMKKKSDDDEHCGFKLDGISFSNRKEEG